MLYKGVSTQLQITLEDASSEEEALRELSQVRGSGKLGARDFIFFICGIGFSFQKKAEYFHSYELFKILSLLHPHSSAVLSVGIVGALFGTRLLKTGLRWLFHQ